MSKTNTFKGYFSGFITVMIFILSFLGMSRLAQAKSIDWGTTSVFFIGIMIWGRSRLLYQFPESLLW